MPWTLLLNLVGPQQSWGLESRFTNRDTGREPSKSGVVGLLCAALGKPRRESDNDGLPPLSQLAALRMGVRANNEGTVLRDYHTTGGGSWPGPKKYGVYIAQGKGVRTVVSDRYYLADADFLVGLEGPFDLLLRLDQALGRPKFQLSLGRKSFVPSLPVRLPDLTPLGAGLRELPLKRALSEYPARGLPIGEPPEKVRLVIELPGGEVSNDVRRDVPLSFDPREFTVRYLRTEFIPNPVQEEPCISPV